MQIGDYGKLIILGMLVAGVFALMGTHTMSGEVGTPMLTVVLGYVVGNGRTAYSGKAPSPTLVAKDPTPVAGVPVTGPAG